MIVLFTAYKYVYTQPFIILRLYSLNAVYNSMTRYFSKEYLSFIIDFNDDLTKITYNHTH